MRSLERPRRVAALVALTTAITTALVLPVAAPAAATDLMEVSWPGGSTTNPNSAPLLDGLWAMLPSDSKSTQFVVTNLSPSPAVMRVTLVDVQSTDAAFARALTIESSTSTTVGSGVPIGMAQPCHVLLEGDIIGAGDSLAVAVDISLGDLEGTAGQSATVEFSIRVALSDALPGSLPPSDCDTGGAVVPGTGPRAPRAGQEPATEAIQQTDSAAPLAAPVGGLAFASNTSRLFEEYTVLFLVIPWLVGIGAYLLLARRRRHTHGEHEK